MAERLKPAYRIGLIVRRNQVKLTASAGDQTGLARDGELLFIRRVDNAYLLELKCTHFAVMFSAEPMHTA